MRRMQWLVPGMLGALLAVTGCATRITNLTPSTLPREESGLYAFEAEWTSTERTRELRQDRIRAYVVYDGNFYAMERVSRMTNRWESLVPIPEDRRMVFYHFKWDYENAGFGRNHPNSIRSQQFQLEIADTYP